MEKQKVVNLNKASEEDLMILNGIGPKKARAIIAVRGEDGKQLTMKNLVESTNIAQTEWAAMFHRGEIDVDFSADDLKIPSNEDELNELRQQLESMRQTFLDEKSRRESAEKQIKVEKDELENLKQHNLQMQDFYCGQVEGLKSLIRDSTSRRSSKRSSRNQSRRETRQSSRRSSKSPPDDSVFKRDLVPGTDGNGKLSYAGLSSTPARGQPNTGKSTLIDQMAPSHYSQLAPPHNGHMAQAVKEELTERDKQIHVVRQHFQQTLSTHDQKPLVSDQMRDVKPKIGSWYTNTRKTQEYQGNVPSIVSQTSTTMSKNTAQTQLPPGQPQFVPTVPPPGYLPGITPLGIPTSVPMPRMPPPGLPEPSILNLPQFSLNTVTNPSASWQVPPANMQPPSSGFLPPHVFPPQTGLVPPPRPQVVPQDHGAYPNAPTIPPAPQRDVMPQLPPAVDLAPIMNTLQDICREQTRQGVELQNLQAPRHTDNNNQPQEGEAEQQYERGRRPYREERGRRDENRGRERNLGRDRNDRNQGRDHGRDDRDRDRESDNDSASLEGSNTSEDYSSDSELSDEPRRGDARQGRQHTHRRRKKSPPGLKAQLFSGDAKKWRSFISNFKDMAVRYKWSQKERRQNLIGCLRDTAVEFKDNLPPEVKRDYKSLKKALNERYGKIEGARTKFRQLFTWKQADDETIDEFADRTYQQLTEAFPKRDSGSVRKSMGVEYFLHGCKDKAAVFTAMNKTPKTVYEALKYVKDAAANLKALGKTSYQSRQVTFEEDIAVRQIQSPKPRFSEKPKSTDNSVDHADLAKQIGESVAEQLKKVLTSSLMSHARSPSPSKNVKCYTCGGPHYANSCPDKKNKSPTSSPHTRSPSPSGGKCFKCGEPGHFQRNCPQRNSPRESSTERSPSKGRSSLNM